MAATLSPPRGRKARLEADFSKRKFGARLRWAQNPKTPKSPNPKNTPKSPNHWRVPAEGPNLQAKGLEARWALEEVVGARRRPQKISKRRRFWRSQPPRRKIDPEGSGRRSETASKSVRRSRKPRNRPKGRHRIDGIDRKRPKSTQIDQNWTGPTKISKDLGPSNLKIGSEARGGFLDQDRPMTDPKFLSKSGQNCQNWPKIDQNLSKSAWTLSQIERLKSLRKAMFWQVQIGCRAGCPSSAIGQNFDQNWPDFWPLRDPKRLKSTLTLKFWPRTSNFDLWTPQIWTKIWPLKFWSGPCPQKFWATLAGPPELTSLTDPKSWAKFDPTARGQIISGQKMAQNGQNEKLTSGPGSWPFTR